MEIARSVEFLGLIRPAPLAESELTPPLGDRGPTGLLTLQDRLSVGAEVKAPDYQMPDGAQGTSRFLKVAVLARPPG